MFRIQLLCLVLLCFQASNFVFGEKEKELNDINLIKHGFPENVICYYGTWATYRWGVGKFDVSHINTDLCTHVVYTFVGLNDQGTVISLDPYLDLPDNWGRDNFGAFNALKQTNPNLKTILAVGGWNEGSARFSVMAANPTLRTNFIESALKMVQDHGFDGLDLDWEYPNRRDTVNGEADVENYTQLLKALREEFDKHGLLLTAAVASVRQMASLSYNIPEISKYLDLINVMTYDMYGSWDPVTGHNSPLHKGIGDEDSEPEDLYTVDVALKYWIDQGAPLEKIVIGVPFYGRTFTLSNSSNTNVRAPSSGPGIAGTYTGTNGFLGYNEFCYKLKTETWITEYDDLAKVPFAYQGQDWVSYDDVDSITKKIEYAMSFNIGGIMVWSIETDDFHGICGNGNFPLLRAVNKAIGRNVTSSPDVTSTMPTTTTPSSSSPTASNPSTSTTGETTNDHVCQEEGFVANPDDCSSFYICITDVSGNLRGKLFYCPVSLLWDKDKKICNYPSEVSCIE